MPRKYCWRVGAVFDIEDGTRCPECACDDHKEYIDNNCGNYVYPGVHCMLPIGHPGKCAKDPHDVIEEVHEP